MMIELAGTEAHTVEIEGVLDATVAARAVGDDLEPRAVEGGVEVSVLFFEMRGLGMARPIRFGPRFDYGEALWRVGIDLGGRPAWLARACDLDRAAIRFMGAVLVKYPVREARVDVGPREARALARSGSLRAAVGRETGSPPAVEPRPLLVRSGGAVFRIPWREDAAPHREAVEIAVEDCGLSAATFGGDVLWRRSGLVHRGRTHRCGIAYRVTAPARR